MPQLITRAVLLGALLLLSVSSADLLSFGGRSALGQDARAAEEWRAVAMGGHHALALTSEGAVQAWGENYYGQCDVPREDGFAAIAAGLYHSLALRRDGSIAVWGDNTRGQCLAPAVRGFVAVGGGDWHCLAIRSDGSIIAWGWNEYGQCDAPSENKYTAICGGHAHSLALTSDGAVVAWGSNADGQCDVPAGNDFIAIAAGAFHSMALRSDGSLEVWGCNDDGQCDVPEGMNFVGIAAGAFHCSAMRNDSSVVAWGHDGYAQCDLPPDVCLTFGTAGGDRSLGVHAEAGFQGHFDGDMAPVLAAVGRFADKIIDGMDRVMLSVAEEGTENSLVTVAPVEAQVVPELIPPAPERAVPSDDATAPETEPSASLAVAESVQEPVLPDETFLSAVDLADTMPYEAQVLAAVRVAKELVVAASQYVARSEGVATDREAEISARLAITEPTEKAVSPDETPVSVVDAYDSTPYEAQVQAVVRVAKELVVAASQYVALSEDVATDQEAEPSAVWALAAPAEEVISSNETALPVAEDDTSMPLEASAVPAAPVVVARSEDDATNHGTEPSASPVRPESSENAMAPDEGTISVAHVDPDPSPGTPTPVRPITPTAAASIGDGIANPAMGPKRERSLSGPVEPRTDRKEVAAAPPSVDHTAHDLTLLASLAKGPLLLAGCVGLGLIAVGAVYLLLRGVSGVIRKWHTERIQRQQMQEDLFWTSLLRTDWPQPWQASRFDDR